MGSLSDSVKKGKFLSNIFSNVEWNSKNLSKMISADSKANINQQKIKELVVITYTIS